MSDNSLRNKKIRNLKQCAFFLGVEVFNIHEMACSPDRSQSEDKSLFSKTLYMGVEISKHFIWTILVDFNKLPISRLNFYKIKLHIQ